MDQCPAASRTRLKWLKRLQKRGYLRGVDSEPASPLRHADTRNSRQRPEGPGPRWCFWKPLRLELWLRGHLTGAVVGKREGEINHCQNTCPEKGQRKDKYPTSPLPLLISCRCFHWPTPVSSCLQQGHLEVWSVRASLLRKAGQRGWRVAGWGESIRWAAWIGMPWLLQASFGCVLTLT